MILVFICFVLFFEVCKVASYQEFNLILSVGGNNALLENSIHGKLFELHNSWRDYRVALASHSLRYTPTRITYYHRNGDAIVCNDSHASDLFVNALNSRKSSSIECNNSSWRVIFNAAHDLYSLCADCSDDSSASTLMEWKLVIEMEELPITWPDWEQQLLYADKFHVAIQYSLRGSGVITCAAYNLALSTAPLSSHLSIAASAVSKTRRVLNIKDQNGSFVFHNLTPDSDYEILCYTQSPWNGLHFQSAPSLDDIYARSLIVHTLVDPDANNLVVTVPFLSLLVNTTSAAIRISFDYLAQQNFTVQPTLTLVSSSTCPSLANMSLISPGQDYGPIGSTSPSKLVFDSWVHSSALFFVEVPLEGCYELSFTVYKQYNDSQSHYPTIFKSSWFSTSLAFYFNATRTFVPPPLKLLSASYSTNTLFMTLRLTGDADISGANGLVNIFDCGLLLDFRCAETAKCWFADTSTLRISSALNCVLLSGETITLRGGVLKPQCPSDRPEVCGAVEYLQPSSVQVDPSGPVPQVVINVFDMIRIGSDLPLSIIGSAGNFGSPWNSISWQVYYREEESTPEKRMLDIEEFLNNGLLLWYDCVPNTLGCDTLPGSYLNQSGFYNFQLTLTNIFGLDGWSASTVQVTSRLLESAMHIFGPTTANMYANTSLILRIRIEDSKTGCPSVAVDWRIYRDRIFWTTGMALQQTTFSYRDARTLVVLDHSLLPGHEYSFLATFWCGNLSYAYDLVTRYVMDNDIVPNIADGNEITIDMRSPLIFDASSSMLTMRDGSAVSYSWRCMQVSPVSGPGCLNFTDANQSKLSFASAGQIFYYGGTYLVSVSVYVEGLRLVREAFQQIHIVQPADAYMPRISVSVPSFTLAGAYGYTVNASVNCSSSCLTEWRMLTTNSSLLMRSFQNGGNVYFPVVIPTNLLFIRSYFTFQLRAIAITPDCNTFACATSSAVTTFTVRINQAPSSGHVMVFPSEGDELTLFDIAAFNWQDPDLPVHYIFYQSAGGYSSLYQMVRQRMQVSYMQSNLVASKKPNNTDRAVSIKVRVIDNLGAETAGYTSALVNSTGANITVVLSTFNKLNENFLRYSPEVALPIFNYLAETLASLQCDSGQNSEECDAMVNIGSQVLRKVMRSYNVGIYLVTGLSSYLNSMVSLNATESAVTLANAISVFSYLTSTASFVGFSRGDGNALVTSLLASCDSIINLLCANPAISDPKPYHWNASDDVLPVLDGYSSDGATHNAIYYNLRQSVDMLVSDYFGYLPFGLSDSFSTSSFFTALMQKTYISIVENNDAGSWSQDFGEFILDRALRATGLTSGVSYMVVSHNVPFELCDDPDICISYFQSKYVQLIFHSQVDPTNSGQLIIDFDHQLNDLDDLYHEARLLSTSPYIYRNCSDLRHNESVSCSSEQTGAEEYTFPSYLCPALNFSQTVLFSCPVYSRGVYCLEMGESNLTLPENLDNGLVRCSFAVNLEQDATSSMFYLTKNYTIAFVKTMTSSPSIKLLPEHASLDALFSSPYRFGIWAVVLIGASALFFMWFLYGKLMKVLADDVGLPAFPPIRTLEMHLAEERPIMDDVTDQDSQSDLSRTSTLINHVGETDEQDEQTRPEVEGLHSPSSDSAIAMPDLENSLMGESVR